MDQTLKEIEILVIDGGSSDGTLDVIEEMKKEDARIRLFHAPSSVGAQFNLGLKEAKGRYIGICEADDYVLPDMYKEQFHIADVHRLDVVRADYYQVCNVGGMEYRFRHQGCCHCGMTDRVLVQRQGDVHFFLEQGVNGFWNGIYRRQFLLEHQIQMNETGGAAYQDITFSFLSQMYAERIWFMSEAYYCYRIDNPGASVYSLHGVGLHRAEYEELEKRLVNTGRWILYKGICFSWMLASYRWFLRGLPEELREKSTKQVYEDLKVRWIKNGLKKDYILEAVQELASALIRNRADFIAQVLSGTDENDQLFDYIQNGFKKDRKIILFGIGDLGDKVEQFFRLHRKEVYFMDNDPFLQKNGVRGKKVFRPEELTGCFPDQTYLIASAFHAQEMKVQLLKLGIREDHILICGDEEFFLRKIFAGGQMV